MTKRLLFAITLIFHGFTLHAQTRPHMVAIRVSSSAGSEFTKAFTALRPQNDYSFSHTDISSVQLRGDSVVTSFLELPTVLHGLSLRPMFPTHSIAFPDIRQRSNPTLFSGALSTTNSNNELRTTEDKIARWFILTYSDSLSPEIVSAIVKKSDAIELAEPRFIRRPLYTPNDTHFSEQFALPLIKVPQAWDVVRCDSTMLLAVDDVGTDWTHEDLNPSIAINWGEVGVDSNGLDKRANGIDDDGNGYVDDWHGWDFGGEYGDAPDNDTRSPDDHGTHTGGIMDAKANNGKGIAGVAFGAKLLPLKTAGDYSGSLDFAFQGIIYAADMHAKAVNCSFGGESYSQAEQDAVKYAFDKECAVVAASGNDGQFKDIYPGAYQGVLDVGAALANGTFAGYADYNTHVAAYAPGGDAGQKILSTLPNNQYGGEYGTSMASPHGCGVVGLVRQRFPWMTAQQTCQQVRATATQQATDSTRHGYIGHGLINAYAAVTDTNAVSARIEQVNIADDIGLGHFVAGETGGIVLRVHNYLKPLKQLWATLEVTEGASAISLNENSVFFGPAGSDQFVENIQAALRLKVADDVGANTRVTIRVTFFDTTVGYGPDIDYFSFIVSPSYLDLNRNNLTVTFTSDGVIGYNDPVTDKQGSGFRWTNAPANIGSLARSVLFNGGLMIASDSQHVVDAALSSSSSTDRDFIPSEVIREITPEHSAAQELVAHYSDSSVDPYYRVGVSITQRSYAFTEGLAANAVVVQYFLHKTGIGTANDSTAAAIYNDWDIGISGAVNITRFDSSKNIAVTYRLDPNYPYVGTAVISALPPGSSLNYHAIRNDGSQGDISTYSGFNKQSKWHAMTEFFPYAGPGDISMAMGVKNLSLASSDSVEMTIVYALAQTSDLLDQTIDQVKSLWQQHSSVTAKTDINFEIYPNPFTSQLHIHWPNEDQATIAIYDALGRTVLEKAANSNACDLTSLRLAPGIYNVEITAGNERYSRTLISNGLF